MPLVKTPTHPSRSMGRAQLSREVSGSPTSGILPRTATTEVHSSEEELVDGRSEFELLRAKNIQMNKEFLCKQQMVVV
ncbi:hypothetical protein EMCRGX_G001219 [Ephydatia muelleri]